ncbi:MAG: hypothetical protein QHJ34_03415 [bacterium]|jgi:hypothetical protein|nr:hypothetical protein [candidate division KSB1 bacterium]MDH7559262.1 hypothetical protein [bacterium]
MKVKDALQKVRVIVYKAQGPLVAQTVAHELAFRLPGASVEATRTRRAKPRPGMLCVGTVEHCPLAVDAVHQLRADLANEFAYLQLQADGSGVLLTSRANLLYSFMRYVVEHLADRDLAPFDKGRVFPTAFKWQRVSYDYFLTQEGRVQRGMDKERYIRELARLGFTHIEVNGLAFPMGLETGPKGEVYPMFYTYCPALDQFVSTELNKGIYPLYYLSANLANLKENAQLARKYGLTPGLLCFEPRSVPEEFFARYPMLRGARVDHPFRSFKPRYNMTTAHPRVRAHYAEMMRKLMREVPELGFLAVWTNDSGAGFEHTKSLYVGRNGGAYLIREWKDDKEIAEVAGENALRFLRLLRDAAREVNPEFRVMTRLESFYGEHDTVWAGLGDGVDVEAATLIARGWDVPYAHPQYPENKAINAGSVYQLDFDAREKKLMVELAEKGAWAHFYFTAGPHLMFDPLLGVPYPKLTYRKLRAMHAGGVQYLAHSGGTYPPELVPYNVNHEIAWRYLFDPSMDFDAELEILARKWAGERLSRTLLTAWNLAEEAILAFPIVTPLYATFGFTWYRLWARPLVPNLDAIPDSEKAFYQDFVCSTPHNPNNVDLSRDVLFHLTTPEKSELDVERIDRYLWDPLDSAIEKLEAIGEEATADLGQGNVIVDHLVRLRALRCWFMTQRNVAAWIAGVHGYMNATTAAKKRRYRDMVRDLMEKEIENTERLKKLWVSSVAFMSLTDKGETPLMYGDNLGELLDRRIELMRKHMDDEPFIEEGYMERRAAELML